MKVVSNFDSTTLCDIIQNIFSNAEVDFTLGTPVRCLCVFSCFTPQRNLVCTHLTS